MDQAPQKRRFSLPLYVVTLAITCIIFGIGVYIGTLLDKSNLSSISTDVKDSLQRLESTQLLFFLDDSTSFCPVYASELEKLEHNTEVIGQKLQLLETKGSVDIDLKKQYFILEAQSYLLSKKIKEKCTSKDILVLYFYSNTNCASCGTQGSELLRVRDETLKKVTYNIKFYSFDTDLGSPIANALTQKYNVTVNPTIVVNEQIYAGYQDHAALLRLFQ